MFGNTLARAPARLGSLPFLPGRTKTVCARSAAWMHVKCIHDCPASPPLEGGEMEVSRMSGGHPRHRAGAQAVRAPRQEPVGMRGKGSFNTKGRHSRPLVF